MIVHLTTVHPRSDTRILVKEARTLAVHLPCTIMLMVADGKGDVDEKEGGVPVRDLGHLGVGRLRRMMRGPWRAFWAIRKIRPEIVHFHDPELIPLCAILKLCGHKIVYDVHEHYPRAVLNRYWLPKLIRRPSASIMGAAEYLSTFIFDAIIPATPAIADHFVTDKKVLVQNFPILSEWVARDPVPYDQRAKSFVYVGVICSARGAEAMVEAAGAIDEALDTRLEFVGECSPEGLEAELRSMSGWGRVNFRGWRSRQEVARALGTARAGLVVFPPTPNLVDAYPVKMFEYMAAGIPVIASDFPLWRRIVDGAGCGLLVDPLNPAAISEAMCWILKHPAEAEAMGRNGRRLVEETYNWDGEANKLVALYKRLLAIDN